MRQIRLVVSFLLSIALVMPAQILGQEKPAPRGSSSSPENLRAYLQKSYADLFDIARERLFTHAEIEQMGQSLQRGREYCVSQFKKRAAGYDTKIKQAQARLKEIGENGADAERHTLHCNIQDQEALKSQATVMANHAIPIAYDNRQAKLELLDKWPEQFQTIHQQIADGSYQKRRWGNVKDIGFREIEPDQEKDIKTGQDAIEQMKRNGLLPKEVEDEAVVSYVNSVAQSIAAHSDLRVPLHVSILNSKEVNAFAFPGGFLFIERGLLEAADDESELAGVIAHEISHVVARHAHKLITRATIAGIFYQVAQIAAVVLTGGVASIGLYYALQYGFYGLGLILDLKLLGVSREYELEADQLGIQYAWNAGYDPSGFIRFFDKMATREGYVQGLGWFRTHPPFFQRMVDAEREILFMSPKPEYVVQTSAFEKMKRDLAGVVQQAQKDEKDKPTLMRREKNCPPPEKTEYQPGMPIESICGVPEASSSPTKKQGTTKGGRLKKQNSSGLTRRLHATPRQGLVGWIPIDRANGKGFLGPSQRREDQKCSP